ncbi:MAG: metal-sulfur cluster assembly factor [Kiritimatiellae bacterium]|nr:metal-sulfur cluster assembly factor [Kiritimatiellia bacterium]MDW8458345.1 metal-sulfur cluster assembly factor [Verrucomicrobiota bacterium]
MTDQLQDSISPEQTGAPSEGAGMPSNDVVWTPDQVREILRGIFDPELHMNIVDLGLVYDIRISGPSLEVDMTLTSPGCPYGPYLIHQVKDTLKSLKGITDAKVNVVWDPPWGPDKMSEEVRLELGFDL